MAFDNTSPLIYFNSEVKKYVNADRALPEAAGGPAVTVVALYNSANGNIMDLSGLTATANSNTATVTSGSPIMGVTNTGIIQFLQMNSNNILKVDTGSLSSPILASVTTAPPSYSNGTTNSVSMDTGGNIRTISGAASSANLFSVACNTTSATLFNANTSSKSRVIVNENSANATLYIAYAATANATSYTYAIYPNYTWAPDFRYTGVISGFLSTGTGSARCTELI